MKIADIRFVETKNYLDSDMDVYEVVHNRRSYRVNHHRSHSGEQWMEKLNHPSGRPVRRGSQVSQALIAKVKKFRETRD
ncbi:hypothetical protein NYP18_08910 [Corynebacterium sp. YIM 101645]|uniref:Uncharacterized protein n=1 Tax=Corynebacterium lemuris TaxID=1859292 RepID=A0ABT2FZ84_9CORY|nr:hypothetical protein [Corynebacterium lemuris]MCS5479778.1 hypothetical protein [Corynebacterium lemuris]